MQSTAVTGSLESLNDGSQANVRIQSSSWLSKSKDTRVGAGDCPRHQQE